MNVCTTQVADNAVEYLKMKGFDAVAYGDTVRVKGPALHGTRRWTEFDDEVIDVSAGLKSVIRFVREQKEH